MQTKNLAEEKFKQLQQLFPNAVTETTDKDGNIVKAIDKDILMQEISSEVVEGPKERYQFTWPDKKKAVHVAGAPTSNTLRPCREESVNFDETENLYIEGDNLEVLKLLQETYLGRVKMIYIDPPYNTGKDFVYNDEFKSNYDEYIQNSGQLDEEGNRLEKNLESNGRFHTDWLNMIYPRLKLARNLLTDDGVIFISIDDNEQANLVKLCNEIFGESNYIGIFKWNKSQNPPSLSKTLRHKFEYILCYKKNKLENKLYGGTISGGDSPIYNGGNPLSILSFPKNSIKFDIPDGVYSESKNSNIELLNSVEIKDGKNINRLTLKGKFRWSQETLEEEISKQTEIIIKSNKFSPRYARNGERKMIPSDLLSLKENGVDTNERGRKEVEELLGKEIFSFPKPTSLIKFLINTLSYYEKDDIILDFFSGSATTASAVMQLNVEDNGNRKFILVQLPEKISENSEAYKTGYKTITEIGKERIRRVGNKIIEDNKDKKGMENLDIGFRVLKTDSSNMKDVYYSPSETQQDLLDMLEDNIKEDRSAEDLLFQVMLDLGISLSSKIKVETIDDTQIHIIEDGFLIACFDKNIDEEVVEKIAKRTPYYAVFRDSSITNDSVAANFEQIFESISPETVRKVL